MKKILWLALNAKFSHTSLAVRYLRQTAAEMQLKSSILELTINNYLPDILSEIYSYRPDILGIGCYIWNIELVKQLLPSVRKVLPDTIIICGGPEVSYEIADFMVENPTVDFVVAGEAEETIKELLELTVKQGGINGNRILLYEPTSPGLSYRKADGAIHEGRAVTLVHSDAPNELRVPFAYVHEEMADIKEKILYYETSRGCPFSCAYCLSCATRGVRYRPYDEIKDELDFFIRHDVRQIKFVDRTFNSSKDHYLPIINYIGTLPESCRTNFHFEIAADYLDSETISLLQSMPRGRVQLEIGIQTTNPQVLKLISRVNHWTDICHNIRLLQRNHNIHIHTDLIIGLPGEDMASFGRSFNALYSLHTDMLQLGFLKFLKGSSMMKLVDEYQYEYMNIGPYEVLSNSVMDYGQLRWLHIFEQVFELYYNAGRCLKSSQFVIENLFAGDAFGFYSRFTDYWEKLGNHRWAIAAKQLYKYLWDFFVSLADTGIAAEQFENCHTIMDNLLRFDALTADSGQNRPEFLRWNKEKFQEQTGAFWRDRLKSGRGASTVLDGFQFTNWRALNKEYHIEFFDVVMEPDLAEQTKYTRRRQVLLFIYHQRIFERCVDITESFEE
ncbi:B12-binding domain-containing radical SAM protein [uncultured Anaerovibrio sp.]|uniref:B12-binding domain-containing radical SAM protein n=1 Tax=uncultured Anaerovibrio sp. TaxID=361586 RepID=UPI002607DBCC|nr:B12-binding domain-containing radical SAM protein [uncultured Anaerovibrio sp.]